MKIALTVLAVGLIILGVLFVNYKQTATQQLASASQKLDTTTQQLTVASNEIVEARSEIAQVKTEMKAQVDQLEQKITTISEEKKQAQEQIQTLSKQLDSAKQDFEQEHAKVESMQKQNEKLNADIQAISTQLGAVGQKLADLEKTHATTVGHLQAMREDYVTLTKEKASLESKLHDLNSLKSQITLVKQEIHEQKVEERKRLDRAEAALGNGGFLMKQGTWQAPHYAGKSPLTEDIRRDQ